MAIVTPPLGGKEQDLSHLKVIYVFTTRWYKGIVSTMLSKAIHFFDQNTSDGVTDF